MPTAEKLSVLTGQTACDPVWKAGRHHRCVFTGMRPFRVKSVGSILAGKVPVMQEALCLLPWMA